MNRSSLRSVVVSAAVAVSLIAAGTADVLAQRSGGGGGRTSGGGGAGSRVSGGVPGGGGGGRAGGAVPGGPGRPVGPGGAVPRPGGPGGPNGQAVVARGGYGYGYGGYCCGYYGYPHGYYSPWYGWGWGAGWGWGGGWGFSVGFNWGYPYGAYYGGYPYAYGYPYPYPYPYSSAYYGRYAAAPGGGYVEAAPEQSRTPIPDQIQQPSASFGMISMKVQPVDAEVLVDGETWTSPTMSRLVIQLAPGRHHVAVRKAGFDTYSEDVLIRVGATMTLNVSLLRGEK